MKLGAKILITVIISLLINPSLSVRAANNVEFYNLNEEFGISIRETNQVLSDNNGFIWISSKMGILRYTQGNIRTYQLPYSSEDIITVRLVYGNDVLYAYTNNGQIFKYNTLVDEFEMVVDVSKALSNTSIMVDRMLVDRQGKLWMASSVGLLSYEFGPGLKVLVKRKDIQDIEWLDQNTFFYVIDGQIDLFNTSTLSSINYYKFPQGTSYSISSMFYDKNNILWIGTLDDGLFYISKNNENYRLSSVPEIPKQPVLAIEANSDSTMLIGIDGQGVWRLNKQNKVISGVYKENSDDPHSLKGNGVYDIYCDVKKRVWICTYSGGVSYFDQANSIVTEVSHVVNNPNSLVNNDVNGVIEDSDGNLWFATNNGISYWNVSTNRWKALYHNEKEHAQVFHDLCEDDEGRIWAGTYSSGVYLIDHKTGKELNHYSLETSNGKFNDNFVFDIYKDSQGNIWIGGVRGDLICYLSRERQFRSYKNFTVKVMQEYRPGQLLFGTTFGLLSVDTSTGKTRRLVEGYMVNDILLMNDEVWLCTGGNGLVRYNIKTNERKTFSFDSGLPSNYVNSIAFSNGYLWVGTEHGLCRMNEDGDSILTYNSSQLLTNISFNPKSHYNLKNGKLLLGTNKGALIFDPRALQTNRPQGRIFFEDLNIDGRSIRQSAKPKLKCALDSLKELSLQYYQNTMSLELIPIGVSSSGSKFSWKLEDLDKEWSKPVENRILSYSNLPIGNYSLRVRMYDNSLTKVIDERLILIHIIPPFWQTPWFRMLIFIFVIGLILFLFSYYINHLNKQHSEEKIRFFANTAHDIRTSLTLIKGPVEELNKEAGLTNKGFHYLHLATEQTQRLLSVVTQLMDFQKVDIGKEKPNLSMVDIVKTIEDRVMMFESYAMHKNIELRFTTNCPNYVTAVDEAIIEKVIENLISNSIKYSFSDKIVQVILQCNSNKWVLEVKDQGIGISKKAQRQLFNEYYRGENAVNSKIVGSGIGLLLVKNYVTLHDGRVSCTSQLNVGSTFQVTIPYKKIDEPVADLKIPQQIAQPLPPSKKINQDLVNQDQLVTSHSMKVLIAEDHDYLREFLKSAMESEFQIYLAEDGEQAWEIIQKETPDLVVSDILMPGMDGFELCSKLKSTYETSHIPIILLTALAGKAQQLKGLGLGADDYLVKPFDVTLLQQRIKSIIQNRQVIREKALKIIRISDGDAILSGNELNDKFLKRMVDVVRENIENTEFSKDDFAAAMNVSRSLLYRKVKSLTDLSPSDFIKSVRLEHSLDLLKSKRYTITEISELCGFSSVSYFSNVFRKHYGKSPTQII